MIQYETAIFNAKKEYFDNIVDELTNVLLLDKRTANYKPRQIKIIFTEQLLKNNWIPKLKIFDKKNSYIQLFKKKTGLSIQMGHFAQSYVDFLKFELAFNKNKINDAVLIVLSKELAKDGNHSSFEDTVINFEEFSMFLNCPLLVVKIV